MRFGIVVVLLAATVSLTFAQAKVTKDEKTKLQLIQIERDIGKANIDRDYDYFDRIEGDEFIFTGENGSVTTKKEDLAGLKEPANPNYKLEAYDVSDVKVTLYAKTAVVTGQVTTKARIKGADVTRQSRFTDVFVWRDGRWQIVAGHSSPIRKAN
jgi:Domain of unknown function (DUF4440)